MALGLLGAAYLAHDRAGTEQTYGPMVTRQEVLHTAPEWQVGGREHAQQPNGLWQDAWQQVLGRLRQKPVPVLFPLFAALAGAAVFGGLYLCGRRRPVFSGVLLAYGLIAMGAYEAAMLLLPRLYNPDRYLNGPGPIVSGALVAIAAGWLWEWGGPSGFRPHRLSRIAVALLVGLAFVGGLAYTPPDEYATDLRPQRPVAAWLRAHLAPSEMFAAYPINDGDNIMTLAERPCLVTHECDWPFHSGYLNELRRRFRLLFPAYFAFSAADVRPLVRETPVRFLVVRRDDVTERLAGDPQHRPRYYWQPSRRQIRLWLSAHHGQQVYWVSPSAPVPVYQDAAYLVFDLRRGEW